MRLRSVAVASSRSAAVGGSGGGLAGRATGRGVVTGADGASGEALGAASAGAASSASSVSIRSSASSSSASDSSNSLASVVLRSRGRGPGAQGRGGQAGVDRGLVAARRVAEMEEAGGAGDAVVALDVVVDAQLGGD